MITWKPGLLLRIKNYKFEDDQTIRDKYAVVLYTEHEQAYIIHSLTTSQNKLAVPGLKHGCSVYGNIPYYFFPQHHVIGDRGFFFEKDTFIFFMGNVRKQAFSIFEQAAAKDIFGVAELGVLEPGELKRLIKCALKSNFIPEAIAITLQQFKDRL
jgi:hypothetical protein